MLNCKIDLAGRRIGLLSAWTSRLGGGVFEAVVTQAALIRHNGGTPIVFGLSDSFTERDAAMLAPYKTNALHCRGPAQVGFAPGLTTALERENLDCLHLHGLWMYPSRAALLWAKQTGRALVISPHGMLDPWITGRGRVKKHLARLIYERASWRTATAFHALTPREGEEVRCETGRTAELIIPNAAPPTAAPRVAMPAPELVYIGRIHPKKNLVALIEGWSAARLPPGSRLTIAGWGSAGDLAKLNAALAKAGPTARFVGAVYGAQKQQLLNQARFLVLPSLGEGLPMAVLEGWAAGVPSILTPECNLPMGFATNAAIECGASPPVIAAALERGFSLNEPQWLAMAAAARDLAAGPFSAQAVGNAWATAYGGLAARCDKPKARP